MKNSNKTKNKIFRVLAMLSFGTFSYWFTHKYNVEYLSLEYTFFVLFTLTIALFSQFEERFFIKHKEDEQKILDIFENAKKIYKEKKESN